MATPVSNVLIMLDTLWKIVDMRLYNRFLDCSWIKVTYRKSSDLVFSKKELFTRSRKCILMSPIQTFSEILDDASNCDTIFEIMNMYKKDFVPFIRQYENSLMECYKTGVISKLTFSMASRKGKYDVFDVNSEDDLAHMYKLYEDYDGYMMSMRICFPPVHGKPLEKFGIVF